MSNEKTIVRLFEKAFVFIHEGMKKYFFRMI